MQTRAQVAYITQQLEETLPFEELLEKTLALQRDYPMFQPLITDLETSTRLTTTPTYGLVGVLPYTSHGMAMGLEVKVILSLYLQQHRRIECNCPTDLADAEGHLLLSPNESLSAAIQRLHSHYQATPPDGNMLLTSDALTRIQTLRNDTERELREQLVRADEELERVRQENQARCTTLQELAKHFTQFMRSYALTGTPRQAQKLHSKLARYYSLDRAIDATRLQPASTIHGIKIVQHALRKLAAQYLYAQAALFKPGETE
ncbi:hypothetical protein GMRT_14541 [Giardia muris]|uniref:Uncharacterized protein n=1 Tax=Giardia muris TaxID=5742 RepID=A0A4Z1SVY2_GIAMU|nr:hypothetical protein GMRT_14541 [Giardia muris]|eukprot:TNJ29065.1 hypothetical protein GMRT_14541 [Giardia muris]